MSYNEQWDGLRMSLTVEQARRRWSSGDKVYAVCFPSSDSSGYASEVRKITEPWMLDFYAWLQNPDAYEEQRDFWRFMSLYQLRQVPNVFCHRDRIQVLIDMCEK